MMKPLIARAIAALLSLMVIYVASLPAYGQATIVIQNNDAANVGFNDPTAATPIGGNTGTTLGQQRLIAFQFATSIWGATLSSGPTITVAATWEEFTTCTTNSGTLASAGAVNIARDFSGAVPGTWYGAAVANALRGSDPNGNPEIRARFNVKLGSSDCLTNLHWYYGLDTSHSAGGINFITVVLHELAHGLGFQTFTNRENGQQAGDDQSGRFPTIYDRFLLDNTTGKTWSQMTDAERVASAINTGGLVWNGQQVTSDAAQVLSFGKDSMGRTLMFSPNPVEGGSSVSHWDRSASPNQLMEPNINSNLTHSVKTPQDLTFSLMIDIGWCANCSPPPTPSPTPTPSPPPNDNFVAAQAISGCSGTVNGTNVSATREPGEPSHDPAGNPGASSVWYQWQAPVTGSLTITTAGSDFDTLLGVYTGNGVNNLTLIVNNDDVELGVIRTSTVTFNATAGTLYRIAVDGWGGETGNIVLNWNASICVDPAALIQLGGTNYTVDEGAGSIEITLHGTSIPAGASVDYATSDAAGLSNCNVFNGIASSRCDYAQSVGTLRFAAGEAQKTISIPIVDDAYAEGNETFTITLSNPTGAGLGTQSTATVTITDNETTTGANPIDQTPFFVRQHYIDFLGREPDPPGFAAWQAVIDNCAPGDTTCDRVHVSSAFFRSPEFEERGYFAYRFYEVALGRKPDFAEFMPDIASVSGFLSEAEKEAQKVAFVQEFMSRPAFANKYNGLTNTAYVDELLTVSGLPGHPGRNGWVDALQAGTKTRAQVLRELVESSEVAQRFFNRAFVVMQYFGYLRRDPDALFLNWIEVLDTTGDFRVMVNGFMNSIEYRSRFGP